MKKLITIIGTVLALTAIISIHAATVSITVLPNTMTNIISLVNGSAKITQIVAGATTATNVTVSFYDSITNSTYRTNYAYTNWTTVLTNAVTAWTNYFGGTNYMTNTAIAEVTNYVAATNLPMAATVQVVVPGNTTVKLDGVNYWFQRGIWVTNTSAVSTAPLTITYQQ